MTCPSNSVYQWIIAIGVAAHSITLAADYWIGKAERFEQNSLVELFIAWLKRKFKRDEGKETGNGKQNDERPKP